MRLRDFTACIAALCIASASSAQTPWEAYLQLPTPENAREVQAASYTDSSGGDERLADDLRLLEVQVDAGDREAVRLAFRLRGHADGAYAETLDIMLGRLVRIHPTLLLEELRTAQGMTLQAGRPGCGMLANFGQEYVDRPRAGAYESARRIAALQSVTRPGLHNLREECVAVLKQLRTEYSGSVRERRPIPMPGGS